MDLSIAGCEEIESQELIGQDRMKSMFMILLAELVTSLLDEVGFQSSGSTSLNYEATGLRPSNWLIPDIQAAEEPVERLSNTLHTDFCFKQFVTGLISVSYLQVHPCGRYRAYHFQ